MSGVTPYRDTLTGITAYHETLRSALGQLADALEPVKPDLPPARHTIDLRSDRPKGTGGISIVRMLPRTEGKASIKMPLAAAKEHRISIPGAQDARVGVKPGTHVDVQLDVRDNLPSIEVGFSKPISVHNPLEFAGLRFLNPLCHYNLEKIYMRRDGSIDIDGSVRLLGMITKHHGTRVREPSNSVHSHSVVELFKAAGQTFLKKVPTFLFSPLSLFMPAEDKRIGDWATLLHSVAPLVHPGSLRWDGTFRAKHPVLIRLDSADIVLPAQEAHTALRAEVMPEQRRIRLMTHPGTQIRSKSANVDFSGTLGVSPQAVVGSDVHAQVKSLRADVFLSNGRLDHSLVPVRFDTKEATDVVAQGYSTFKLGKKKNTFNGRVDFNLPAHITDHSRLLSGSLGEVAVHHVDLDTVLRGHVATSAVKRDVKVNLDIPNLRMRGDLTLAPETARKLNSVEHLPLDIDLTRRKVAPMRLEMQYGAPDQGVPRGGAAVSFDVFCNLAERNLLTVQTKDFTALVDRMGVALDGALRFGSMSQDARKNMEGELAVRGDHLGARVLLNPILLDTMQLRDGTVLETTPTSEEKPALDMRCIIQQEPGREVSLFGTGRADIPVQLKELGPLNIKLPLGDGAATVTAGKARLQYKPLRVMWKPSGYSVSGDLSLRYGLEVKGKLARNAQVLVNTLGAQGESPRDLPAIEGAPSSASVQSYDTAPESLPAGAEAAHEALATSTPSWVDDAPVSEEDDADQAGQEDQRGAA